MDSMHALRRRRYDGRRGAMLLLVLLVMSILLVAATFSVDVAYMQLTRTQLRIATDAAARAAAEAINRTQDERLSREVAKRIANQHYVAGKPLALRDEDIVFGHAQKRPDGKWAFVANEKPWNSAQVLGDRTGGSFQGAVPLAFGRILGKSEFEPVLRASAGKVGSPKRDFCLVVDRSHSMSFDLSNEDWTYPGDILYTWDSQTRSLHFEGFRTPPKTRNGFGGRGKALYKVKGPGNSKKHGGWGLDGEEEDDSPVGDLGTNFLYYQTPVHPALSRWAALADASAVFFEALNNTDDSERVGLVSYSTDVTIDERMTTNYGALQSQVDGRRMRPMPGATNIAGGLTYGRQVLTAPGATREGAKKILVLMTDGVWNEGGSPLPAARQAAAAGITIITITFSRGANQTDMRAVAEIGGGQHYHAPTREELLRIFKQIAEGTDQLVFIE